MATCLVGGLIARGTMAASIVVADPIDAQRERLERRFGVQTDASGATAVQEADVVVLAVKPQQMAEAARAIAPTVAVRRPLVISIAAGIRLADLARWLGAGVPLVRTMPNLPALIDAGVTALFAPHERRRGGAPRRRDDPRHLRQDGLGPARGADGRRHRRVRHRPRVFLPADGSAAGGGRSNSGSTPRRRGRSASRPRKARAAWRPPPNSTPRNLRAAGDFAAAARPLPRWKCSKAPACVIFLRGPIAAATRPLERAGAGIRRRLRLIPDHEQGPHR